jgi:sugar phosphate isomerase/epimerase
MSDEPTREHLQRVLREARAGSAGGQADLDDPHRAALLQQMVELREKAKAMGLDHVVVSAQAAIDEMKAAEDALRASLTAAERAHDLGLKILIQKQGDQD